MWTSTLSGRDRALHLFCLCDRDNDLEEYLRDFDDDDRRRLLSLRDRDLDEEPLRLTFLCLRLEAEL